MKKISLIKGILLILLSFVLIGTNVVFAADGDDLDDEFDDIMNFSGESTDNSTGTNTGNVAENSSVLNFTGNESAGDTNIIGFENEIIDDNSSIYTNEDNEVEDENSSLPSTGIEDSIPTVVLIVIFGISAVYAYNKIREYNNL